VTLSHFLRAFAARWLIVLATTVCALVAAMIYAFIAPNLYRATASVLVNVRAPETIGSQSVADQLASDYLLTQEDVLKSPRVARQVVDNLGLAAAPGAAGRFGWTTSQGPLSESIAKILGSRLVLGSSATNSRVMTIGFVSTNPQFSATVANAFADAYADVTVQLQADPARRTVESYSRQLAALSKQLQDAQARLGDKEKSLGIVSSDAEQDADTLRLNALSSELAAAQAEQAASQSRTRSQSLPAVLASPVYQALESNIAQLEGQRELLATNAGPNNPEYRQLVSQIAALRAQEAAQRAVATRGASAASSQSASTVADLKAAVDAQRQRVIQMRANKSDVSVLAQDVANLKASYDQVAARRSQLKVLEDNAQTNIAILSRAVPELKPVAPRRFVILLASLIGGAAAGIGFILVTEFINRPIRCSDEFEAWLGIPNLGVIKSDRKRLRGYVPVAALLGHNPGSAN
jgi:polysaccharide biosynthesis transport protein